jgi:hypothetical protein
MIGFPARSRHHLLCRPSRRCGAVPGSGPEQHENGSLCATSNSPKTRSIQRTSPMGWRRSVPRSMSITRLDAATRLGQRRPRVPTSATTPHNETPVTTTGVHWGNMHLRGAPEIHPLLRRYTDNSISVFVEQKSCADQTCSGTADSANVGAMILVAFLQ